MKLGIKTCTLTLPYEEALDFCVQQEIPLLEIATGNWSAAPHIDLDTVVSDKGARDKWYKEIEARGLVLDSLNCAGNPLGYEHDMDVTVKTFRLAEQLGVKKIVMMSGLPAGCKGDKTPVWVTTSWPPETQDILKYLGEHRRADQVICGFSMETENMLENSQAKLKKKNVDMICANNLKVAGAGFGVDTNVITLITADGFTELPLLSKEEAANRILDAALDLQQH